MIHRWIEDDREFVVDDDQTTEPVLRGAGFRHSIPAGDEAPLAREIIRLAEIEQASNTRISELEEKVRALAALSAEGEAF